MAKKTDDKVMKAVEAALAKNPDASVDELYTMATGVDKSVSKLTKRQFHARYPLQVKRKLNPPKRRRSSGRKAKAGRTKPGSGSGRDAVREIFLEFAAELAAAEDRKDAVRVVAGVDGWVDRVLAARG